MSILADTNIISCFQLRRAKLNNWTHSMSSCDASIQLQSLQSESILNGLGPDHEEVVFLYLVDD